MISNEKLKEILLEIDNDEVQILSTNQHFFSKNQHLYKIPPNSGDRESVDQPLVTLLRNVSEKYHIRLETIADDIINCALTTTQPEKAFSW